ncbi:hypothetical protein THIAE_01655 [Thiomicrospira aerophila AL3]|uniref:Uncharacterized protein n=1 Tax=Thiomicrospira aerophila AL3 TaxID=717772 RepID=W0DUT5_9GAMM|nr:hypothetical protein [Thiomicrospira aerophila]AHF00641.1 hypothetical protein THIAE_01655 [Thiomicrospira aerophila AL3]
MPAYSINNTSFKSLSLMAAVITGLVATLIMLGGCSDSTKGPSWPLLTDCDLHQQACLATSPDQTQQVELALSPQPIPIARPIEASVQLHGFEDVTKVELDIAGINMYMGYNRVNLHAQPNNMFAGQTMLAFCTNEVMQWQVTLLIHHSDGQVSQVPFLLETRNR